MEDKATNNPSKTNQKNTLGIKEPQRVSMYETLLKNLRQSGRKTFIHRLIYAGKHNFPPQSQQDSIKPITDFFIKINEEINTNILVFEKLTGFLVYSNEYFIHFLEGDENALNRHVKQLLTPEFSKNFEELKLLAFMQHINNRYFPNWMHYYGNPEKSESKSFNRNAKTTKLIIDCLNNLIELYNNINKESVSTEAEYSHQNNSLLPESEEMDFIFRQEFPCELKDFVDTYGASYDLPDYKDLVWPIPTDFIPFDVFDEEFKVETRFPKESKELED